MGAFGDIISAFEGDPSFKVLDKTKSGALQAQLDQLLRDYSDAKSKGSAAVQDFITKFTAASPKVNSEGQQEIGNIDRYFNGDIDKQLAGMRATRGSAIKAAGDLAFQQSQKSLNRAQLVSGGSGNSYLARLGLKNASDIGVGEALDQSNTEKGDFNWLEGNKINLTGRREGIQDALTNRVLVPSQVQKADNSSNLGFLQGWQQVNNANKFYGLQQERTVADRVGQGLDGALQLVMDYYTGGMMKNPSSVNQSPQSVSGGGGGGFSPSQTTNASGSGYVTPLPASGSPDTGEAPVNGNTAGFGGFW